VAASSDVLDGLRTRLSDLERQHEALEGAATPEFLASLAPGVRAAPTGPRSAGSDGVGQGGRRRTKDAPPAEGPQRRGPWATVPEDAAKGLDPQRDLDSAGAAWSDLDAWYAAEAAAGRSPEPSPKSPIDPTAVTTDAVLGASLARHDQAHLTFAAEHIAALRASQDVMLVNILAELHARGGEIPRGLSMIDWLRTLDPSLSAGVAKAFVTVARAFEQPRWQTLRARVSMQHVSVSKAAQIIDFHERTHRVAEPQQLEHVIEELTTQAEVARPEELAGMIREETHHVTPPPEAEALDKGQRASRGLWFGQPNAAGMVGMRGLLDPEAAATIQSAVDALAKPQPEKDECGHTVGPDPRNAPKRRADALVDIVGRAVAAARGVPVTDKAKVVVTISHDALRDAIKGTGMTLAGQVLTASVVRRLACHAAIIPMVLGSQGEPLDVGRTERLVTMGMRVALNQRDQGCSFRGCTAPATWCDAHHVVPWYLGGPTDLHNLALLCSRHHHYVHQHDLSATVSATGVTWHE